MTTRETIPISSIQLVDRQRTDLGNITELAASLQRHGLIQPVVVNRDHRLIAGGRRIAAATSLGWTTIEVVYREALTSAAIHMLELEENVRRKDMDWKEQSLAIDTIHRHHTREAALAGKPWTYQLTAEAVDLSYTVVATNTPLAAKIRAGDKELIACDSARDAIRCLLRRKEDEANKILVSSGLPPTLSADPQQIKLSIIEDAPKGKPFEVPLSKMLFHGDAIAWMSEQMDEAFHHIVTDPPYAIDMENLQQENQGMDVSRTAAEHDVIENVGLLEKFLPQAARILRPRGFIIMWYDLDHHTWLQDLAADNGLVVQRWPVIWIKPQAMNNAATYNFTKSFETCMIMRKPGATLREVRPLGHILASADGDRRNFDHPFVKPVEVWKWLYNAIALRGDNVLDPFMGAGSSIVAAIELGLRPFGVELKEAHYNKAVLMARKRYTEVATNGVVFE